MQQVCRRAVATNKVHQAVRLLWCVLALCGVLVALPAPAEAWSETDPADAVEAEPAQARPRRGKWIEVILSQQRLIAWQDGRAVMSSPISSGLPRTPTRRGTFRIRRKYAAVRMRGPGYDLPRVPYAMFYSGGYAIHGAYWHNNFGQPMSHGCVNLPVSFAARLFAWAPRGTLVIIH
ncbi:MAG: L,D-transpeptidase [Anaerolineae bacterium]|nr:L,D-transpeptidase [Thermoflexales bacterium]MDW8406964.1 L,D-transpeptidase [Anaerolineae bacterium]